MKHILMLGTGGSTIACKRSDAGLKPVITSEEILSYVPDSKRYCDIDSLQVFNIDSTVTCSPATGCRRAIGSTTTATTAL